MDKGAREANYEIGRTGLKKPNAQFVFDRVTISGGKFISAAASVAIGKKDKPARASKTADYDRQLKWVERRFVVFYDWKDRRAWLLDGLTALLHLVRAHVAHRRATDQEVIFSDDMINEANPPHTGKAAAWKFFKNKANMDLQISEIWNRPVIESSTEENTEPKLTVKRQQTFVHLVDLVGDIFGNLSMLFDIQTDASTADGFGARVRVSPRRHLEGWDFFDVATLEETVWPKAVSLLDTGLGWVDLTRSISAITLFGVGFGELIQPGAGVQPEVTAQAEQKGAAHILAAGSVAGDGLVPDPSPLVGPFPDQLDGEAEVRIPAMFHDGGALPGPAAEFLPNQVEGRAIAQAPRGFDVGGVVRGPPVAAAHPRAADTSCTRWPCLPTGRDLLATTTPVIKDIRDSSDPGTASPRLRTLATDIYWHIPDKIFEECYCGGEEGNICDRVQVLLPTKFPKIFARGFRSPGEPLPENGAVIFGHSWKFPLCWPLEAGSVPMEGSVGQQPLARPEEHHLEIRARNQLPRASDSGLGTSVVSSLMHASSQVSTNSGSRRSRGRKLFSRALSKLKRDNVPKE